MNARGDIRGAAFGQRQLSQSRLITGQGLAVIAALAHFYSQDALQFAEFLQSSSASADTGCGTEAPAERLC
jgi:hypothetical protein